MADFKNEVNEISPDEAFVEVLAKRLPEDKTRLKLDRVKAGNSKVSPDSISPVDLANQGVTLLAKDLNRLSPVVTSRSLDSKVFDSISTASHEILYLDVGRWGGPAPTGKPLGVRQRNFGLICGSRAALCEFKPAAASIPSDQFLILDSLGKAIDTPINTALTAMRTAKGSVRILRHGMSGNPNLLNGWTPNDTTVHIVLPDFHLPVCTAKPSETTDDGHHMGRFEYLKPLTLSLIPDDHGMVKPLLRAKHLGKGALDWFDRYLKGDIFGHADETAAVDLIEFLDTIETMTLPVPLTKHFVQVGDLYDLWIGLEAFFSQQNDHRIVLKNNLGILAGDFIDEWCRRTEDALMPSSKDPRKNIVTRLNALSFNPGFRSSWLHGNHDNYLAVHTAQKRAAATCSRPASRSFRKAASGSSMGSGATRRIGTEPPADTGRPTPSSRTRSSVCSIRTGGPSFTPSRP